MKKVILRYRAKACIILPGVVALEHSGAQSCVPAGRGAVQAGAICFVLFQICGLVDGYFANQEMPDQYTARNVTVTLRTIVRGLAYLMTFLFGVNCVGLTGKCICPFLPKSAAQILAAILILEV